MKIKDLKEFIKDLPDDMPVQLVDISTDDIDQSNYVLTKEDISIEDYVLEPDGETAGKMLAISFINKK